MLFDYFFSANILMCKAMEELFNSNKSILKSMLLDEEKLITYVSISKDLCVHVNTSKILLQRIVEHIREESPDLQINVSYLVCGVTEKNNARTIVCSEKDLFKVKQSFVKQFFEHIYSITKGSASVDTAAYLNINRFEDFALCSGLIKSKQCDKLTLNEIGDLKSNSQEILAPEKSKSLPVPLKTIKQETNMTKNSHNNIQHTIKESQSEPLLKNNVISPKKEVVEPIVNSKPKVNSNNGQRTQKGIAGFFNKTNNNNNNKKIENDKLQSGKETKVESKKTVVKNEKMEIDIIVPSVAIKEEELNEVSNNKILNQIKKTSKVDKKRKRVLHVSDSESDNDTNDPFLDKSVTDQNEDNHDSEDEIPSTPMVKNIVIKSGIINPRKRRKVVDKTFTDGDGYMMTKKVEVYESCSENEEESKVAEKPKQAEIKSEITPKGKSITSKKISPSQKGKQPTMTCFFKKV